MPCSTCSDRLDDGSKAPGVGVFVMKAFRKRTGASFRVVASDEAVGILSNTEKAHERLVRFFWPRMYPGYDFTDESRRALADSGVIVAFTAS